MLFYKTMDDRLNRRSVQHDCGIYLLKRAVMKSYGICVSEADIKRTEQGKPYFSPENGVHFSISHCRGLAVCLLSDKPCGVDCEPVRRYSKTVASRVCSSAEAELLCRAEGEERDVVFTSLWTLKEAYAKADGNGISVMRRAEFCRKDGVICANVPYNFEQLSLLEGKYIVSLCLSPGSTFSYDNVYEEK